MPGIVTLLLSHSINPHHQCCMPLHSLYWVEKRTPRTASSQITGNRSSVMTGELRSVSLFWSTIFNMALNTHSYVIVCFPILIYFFSPFIFMVLSFLSSPSLPFPVNTKTPPQCLGTGINYSITQTQSLPVREQPKIKV